MERELTGPSLNQINVFLVREGVTVFDDALRAPEDLDMYEIAPAAGFEGRLYVKQPEALPPDWYEFLDSVTSDALEPYKRQSVSAILLVRRADRVYAVSFGYGRYLLEPDALEPDFGLEVAAGLIDPEAINSVDSRLVQATRLQVRRQAGRATTSRDIGIDIGREMLRALSGEALDETLGTRVTGSDSVGLAGKVDPDRLLARLDTFRDTYDRRVYRERFPYLDRWRPVKDGRTRDELDASLADAFRRRDGRLAIAVPEIIDWRGAGFRFTREHRDTRHAFPSIDAYLATLEGDPSIKRLRADRLIYVGGDTDTSKDAWNVYKAVEWEHQIDGKVFFLTDGRWYEVSADFLDEVDGQLSGLDRDPIDGPDFDPREWEEDFNPRLASHADGRLLLDRNLARFEHESGRVEMCDVYASDGWFMHVKRDLEAPGLSHLFAQGSVSAELFVYNSPYRQQLRTALSADPVLESSVPLDMPRARDFGVAFGVISAEHERVPLQLPVFSRIHLLQMAEMIQRLGMRLKVYGIPVSAGARPLELGETEPERRVREKAEQEAAAAT